MFSANVEKGVLDEKHVGKMLSMHYDKQPT